MTRRDAQEFVDLATEAGVRTTIEVFPLEAANDALAAIAGDAVGGAAVLRVADGAVEAQTAARNVQL